MKFRLYAAPLFAALVLTAACGGEKAGIPETETTGTAQSVSETSTASAPTTGATGGSITAMSNEDKEFASKAGMGGLFEVQAGNLAVQKASSAEVKSFAQRMVADHSRANDELSQLATTKGLALPTELDGDHKAALDHLNALSGAEFDKAYMTHMVEDHQKDVAEFEKASTSATDGDLRGWATSTLPVLREHHSLATTTAQRLK
jgi:putative membrane protein